ncbi:MAG TPA: hypothetical protein VFU00_01760, partial [Gemmatimonadales bacterium]|nr:hypothetical protein [Gemmatimonadales bacterium]
MKRTQLKSVVVGVGILLAACGGETVEPPDNGGGTPPPPPPPPSGACAAPVDIALQPGSHVVVNPTDGGGCVRFPAPGNQGAEYLYAALATNGTESQLGVSVSYKLSGASVLTASEAATSAAALPPTLDPSLGAFKQPRSAEAFHQRLRASERALSEAPGALLFNRSPTSANLVAIPPTVGHQRTFKVCETTDCNGFVDVAATAKYVGPKGAIYLDNSVPAGGYTQADLDAVGFLFDNYLYPIDTTAFGRESDLDNNGVVVVLLTDQVNALSGNCNAEGSVILGYFFGTDLLTGQQGSNGGEVFYGLVPDPNNSTCTISRDYARGYLAPTFIHEFQHMISF